MIFVTSGLFQSDILKRIKQAKNFFFVYFGHSVKEFFTLFWEHNLRLYP